MKGEELYTIGVITGTHGRFGKLKVHPLTDFPKRFLDLKEVYLELGETRELFVIKGVNFHQQIILLLLHGISCREEAINYKSFYLKIPKGQLVDLPHGHYFYHEIIGLHVMTDTGEELGTVVDIIVTGSNDVYVVQGETEVLIPALKEVVKEIDLLEGIMRVKLLDGLL